MKTDIEIAQEATLLPIKEVAANIGIKEDDLPKFKYSILWGDTSGHQTK